MRDGASTDPGPGPYLLGVEALPERLEVQSGFPFDLPYVRDLDLARQVTFFVGENGSGKSTLLEAIGELCGFSLSGGGRDDSYEDAQQSTRLASALRPAFRPAAARRLLLSRRDAGQLRHAARRPRLGPGLSRRPLWPVWRQVAAPALARRGLPRRLQAPSAGRALHIDEPESALSPQRQLALMALLHDRVTAFGTQFIVATHSPLLLTYPGAVILNFDEPQLSPIALQDTRHFQITQGLLSHPERHWKQLLAQDPDDG